MANPLENSWALILGASSGFGEAAALELAEQGMNIFGVHLDRKGTKTEGQHGRVHEDRYRSHLLVAGSRGAAGSCLSTTTTTSAVARNHDSTHCAASTDSAE